MLWLRALAVWAAMMAAESLHGALRRLLFGGDPSPVVRLAGVGLATIIVFILAWLSWRWMRVRTAAEAIAVGVGWLVLTLGFELGLGRAVGLSWLRIAADYDLLNGGLMPVGLAILGLSPLLLLRVRGPAT